MVMRCSAAVATSREGQRPPGSGRVVRHRRWGRERERSGLWAVALETGEPFFGRAVNEKVGTLIIAAEGREDMQARIAAAKKHINVASDLPILWMAVPEFGAAFLKDLDRVN